MAQIIRRELMLALDAKDETPLYTQLYRQVRDAIAAQQLAPGDRLPSIRKLCEALGVSHTTVEQAYLQLAVEGYVRNVPRSGYVVEKLDTDYLQLPRTSNIEENVRRAAADRDTDAFYAENDQGGQTRYDFSYANLPADSFPVKVWRKLEGDVLYAATAPEMARYTTTAEPSELARQLARYLSAARGVNCLPEQVVPQAGTDGALACTLALFNRDRHVLGIEEPGYATVREAACRLGFRIVPLSTHGTPDDFLASVERESPKIVFCTPSHQFPTGAVLPLEARVRLLKWAQANNAYIIEDDSCCEYRYDIAPIPSLQSLDAYQRVIYLNNFSKALSPALRTAYLVLPPKLLGRYLRLFNYAHPQVPFLQQQVLARFIAEGHWERHVRRMAQGMKRRHDLLLSNLEQQMGGRVAISGQHAGMHLYVRVDSGMTQRELMERARAQGAAVYSTGRMWFSRPAPENYLMVGFSAIPDDRIAPGVEALRRAWFER